MDSNDELRETFSMEIEGQLDVKVIEFSQGQNAIQYLESHPYPDLAISNYNSNDLDKNNAKLLFSYIHDKLEQGKNRTIPFIIFSDQAISSQDPLYTLFSGKEPLNIYLRKPEDSKKLISIIEDLLSLNIKNKKEFCKVGIKKFLNFNYTICDIYINLSDNKYLKIINQNELYSFDIIEKFKIKGIDFFYIKQEDFSTFTEHYAQLISSTLSSTSLTEQERIESEVDSLQFVHETIHHLGIDEGVIKAVNAVMDSNTRVIKNIPDLGNLLKKMVNAKNYIYEHSLLNSYVCAMIVQEMNWSTEGTIQKMALASLMHDMALIDPELAMISELTEETINKKALDYRQIGLIRKHPLEMAQRVNKIKNFVSEVDQIIINHHERPDGSGFPKGLQAAQLSPLSCIFIVTEEFVNTIYKKETNKEILLKVIADLEKKYSQKHFAKVISALKKAIDKVK